MKHLIFKICKSPAAKLAAIAALGLATSGCVYDAGLGLGYASDGYASGCDSYNDFDSYYDCDYGYGFSNIGYGGGWYSDYYYPGYGYFVFDSYGRRYQMHDDHRRYWGGQRYNWYRDHGRGHGNNYNGGGYGNNGGNHGNGGHNGNGGHDGGNGNGGGGAYSGPRPGILDGGFGRRPQRPGKPSIAPERIKQSGAAKQNDIVNNAPPPRNMENANPGNRQPGGVLGGGFGRRSQDSGASAPVVRQAPQAARVAAPIATPRPAPPPRPEAAVSARREISRERREQQ
jgi:hypothetical protein